MGFLNFDSIERDHKDDYEKVKGEHQSHLSHEVIAGAAAYEATKAYQDHLAKNGQPSSHEHAKEIFASLAAGIAIRLAETKGLDFLDQKKAEHEAKKRAEQHFN